MLRRTYNWILNYAEHPNAIWALVIVAFAESSFFPIPPDPLYLAMLIANRQNAWKLAMLCTLSSVVGGVLGYYIGFALYESMGRWIIMKYGMGDTFANLQGDFNRWGFWIIALKGLTPIPYKFVTIASGLSGLGMTTFITASIIARGFRFFLLAGIIVFCGPTLKDYLEKNIGWLAVAGIGVLALGFAVLRYIDTIRDFCCQIFS